MNSSNTSSKKELQGLRPTPLQVRKNSHKIKKPTPSLPQQQHHPPPVIIYTVSPKKYHVNSNEFMQLVQRLTGNQSSSSTFDNNSAAVSPAARFASTHYFKSPKYKQMVEHNKMFEPDMSADIDEITGMFPGILSPAPNSLPPVPTNIFATTSENSTISFSSRNNMDSTFVPSHSNNSFSNKTRTYSPSSQDFFINFYDI